MADLPSFSTKEFYWLASCFCGIITCKLVYDITGFISPFCFKGYGKLSDKEKMEWNNRCNFVLCSFLLFPFSCIKICSKYNLLS
ncbi:hypothetical protein V6Z12_D12G000500 [Gossypium hirsutum]